MKIASKISLSFLGTAMLLTVVTLSIIYTVVRNDLQKALFNHLITAANSRAHHIETLLDEHKGQVELLAKDILLKNTVKAVIDNSPDSTKDVRVASVDVATSELREALKSEEHFQEIFLLDPSGKIVISTEKSHIGLDRSKDAYFKEGRKGHYIKGAYYSVTTKKDSLDIAVPVFDDEDKQLLGVLVARFALADLFKITSDRTGLGETGEIYLINKDGYMIIRIGIV